VSNTDKPLSRASKIFLILLPALMTLKVPGDVTATCAGLGLLVWLWCQPGERYFRAPWFGAILLLWVYMLMAAPLAMAPLHALGRSFIFIRGPLFALCLVLLLLRKREQLELFEKAALGWCIFIMLDSLFQYVVGMDILGHARLEQIRLTGPFNKNVPGIYSLRLYPMAIAGLLLVLSQQRARWLAHGLMVFMLLAELFSFLSGERIVFLLFTVINLAALVAVVWVLRPSRTLLLSGLAVLLAGAVGVVLYAQTMVARTIGYFLAQLRNFQDTGYYDIFRLALRLWQQSPWVGIGTGYYTDACKALHYETRYEGCPEHPHNIYLQWLSENGVIGLLLFVLFLFLLFRQLLRGLDFKREPLLALMVLIAPLAIFWPVMTSMSMFANNYAGLVWLSVAWAVARSQLARRA
jgi:O-antigen ligase